MLGSKLGTSKRAHAVSLLDKTAEAAVKRVGVVVADPQYSSRRVRERSAEHGIKPVIPFPLNQRRGESVLRFDGKFRVYGPGGGRVGSMAG